jgi:hypothetical protein
MKRYGVAITVILVDWPEPRLRSCPTKNRKLLAEHEVLRNEARTGPQGGSQRADNGLQDREHRGKVRAGRGPCHTRLAPADAVCCAARHALRLRESCENAFSSPQAAAPDELIQLTWRG